MITLLDTLGPAIWRASWQAAVLALLVVLLLRSLGERLSPRWRFLLWSVVLIRLLFVATPASPWSVFNLVRWNPEANARPIAQHEADPKLHAGCRAAGRDLSRRRPICNRRCNRRELPSRRRNPRRASNGARDFAAHFLRDAR